MIAAVNSPTSYDGDPTQDIRDINKIKTVVKGGKVYDPTPIEKAFGVVPR